MQKENLFFFSFPNASDFGQAKVTKKTETFCVSVLYYTQSGL